MDKQEFHAALALVSTVGFLSALMPGIEKLWQAEPTDPTLAKNLMGATAMFSGVSAILIVAAVGVGYRKAAALGTVVLVSAIFYYHYAYKVVPVTDPVVEIT